MRPCRRRGSYSFNSGRARTLPAPPQGANSRPRVLVIGHAPALGARSQLERLCRALSARVRHIEAGLFQIGLTTHKCEHALLGQHDLGKAGVAAALDVAFHCEEIVLVLTIFAVAGVSRRAETADGMKVLPRPSVRLLRGNRTPRATQWPGKSRDERCRTRRARARRNRARARPRRRTRASRLPAASPRGRSHARYNAHAAPSRRTAPRR